MTARNLPRNKPAIVVIGDINVDMLGRVKSWPEPGQDCLAPELEMHCGGVGANSALALAHWGAHVRLVGCVGRDRFGDYVLECLKNGGVNTHWVQRTTGAMTGFFYINVTPDGERTFFGSRAANGRVQKLRNARALCKGASAAHLVGYNFLNPGPARAATQIAQTIHARGGWVSLDVGMAPSQQIPRKILQFIPSVDILLISSDEATLLTGSRNPYHAFALLQKAGAHEVVLKLGKRGCLISESGASRRTPYHVPSFDVKMVDSTGAGDAFIAGFLQARLRGWSVAEAAVAATAGGAAAVGFVGAGEKLPGAREVATLLRVKKLPGKWDAVRQQVLARLQNRTARGKTRSS
ncbi:MAG: carbohydrate kinase family protein [Candidatus Acidiferrales bacterium]